MSEQQEIDIAQEEYQMQHFHLTANELLSEVKTLVSSTIRKKLLEMYDYCKSHYNLQDNSCIDEVHKRCMDHFQNIFKELQEVYQAVFHIDDNILLDVDTPQDFEYSPELEANLKAEIQELGEKYIANQYALSHLEEECETLQKLEPTIKQVDKLLKYVCEFEEEDIVKPISKSCNIFM